jgi:hypothetical protein
MWCNIAPTTSGNTEEAAIKATNLFDRELVEFLNNAFATNESHQDVVEGVYALGYGVNLKLVEAYMGLLQEQWLYELSGEPSLTAH